MKVYTNSFIGIELPLQNLEIYKDESPWLVLKHPSQEAYLSIQFCFQFFRSLEEIEEYFQKEIQLVADAGNLVQFNEIKRYGKDAVVATYFQYIDNISHYVFMTAKLIPDQSGYWYLAVTKNEIMTDYCEPLMHQIKKTESDSIGTRDKLTEKKLCNHTLKYLSSYNSNWGSGGGTSSQKFFTLYSDSSFKYEYSSVISFGSMGGDTSRDDGWGMWNIQKNNNDLFLILRWHLKGISVYKLEWGEPGILFLDGEKYFID